MGGSRGIRWSRLAAALAAVCLCVPGAGADSAGADEAGQGQAARPANQLANQTSPYLLLHVRNPVNWLPWSQESLAKARREGKLIFLSVGYSSCYWCHVMERESFMDEKIAAYLNEHFVPIKVDREERPDVDEIYMTALQATGRRGGWPLTMFLTPEAKPFFGVTYLPPRDRRLEGPGGVEAADGEPAVMTGLETVLVRVVEAWRQTPEEIRAAAEGLTTVVQRSLVRSSLAGAKLPGAQMTAEVESQLAGQFDATYGGFGYSETQPRRPKFPEPTNLVFLLDRLRHGGNEQTRRMLTVTLDRMAAGGIYDHAGGGFHRYSTDRWWRIPHFEKMLYDNGQLASVYAEAYALTGRAEYRRVVEGIAAFVGRELTSPEGAFYAALDAETEAEEGRYYVWTSEELAALLDADELALLQSAYELDGEANFEGRWVLVRRTDSAANRPQAGGFDERLAAVHRKLLDRRQQRPRPLTDTKILTSWNGLMIAGLADAGRLLDQPRYVESAARAARFVLDTLRSEQGRLLRTYAGGQARLNAYLDDYAFLAAGLIALYEAGGERAWLEAAAELTELQIELFWDDAVGGFFYTSDDHETLIARSKDPTDSATPSANAVAAGNLVYLAQAVGRPEYLDRAERTIAAFASLFERVPAAMPQMALALVALQRARGADGGGQPKR